MMGKFRLAQICINIHTREAVRDCPRFDEGFLKRNETKYITFTNIT